MSVATVALGAGWSADTQRSWARLAYRPAKVPAATIRFAPLDLAAVSLRDFGDVDHQ